MQDNGLVYIVDDDPSMRNLMGAMVRALGADVKTFSCAEEFAAVTPEERASCLLLDLEMPGLSGLEFLERHVKDKIDFPIIIVTGHASVPSAVKSLKLGAVDFVEKPFERETLAAAVTAALEADRQRRAGVAGRDDVRKRLESLSPREAELLTAVIEGKSTKMIADELGISARTVDHHRANLMAKMKAANVADLVRMAVEAGPVAKSVTTRPED